MADGLRQRGRGLIFARSRFEYYISTEDLFLLSTPFPALVFQPANRGAIRGSTSRRPFSRGRLVPRWLRNGKEKRNQSCSCREERCGRFTLNSLLENPDAFVHMCT